MKILAWLILKEYLDLGVKKEDWGLIWNHKDRVKRISPESSEPMSHEHNAPEILGFETYMEGDIKGAH